MKHIFLTGISLLSIAAAAQAQDPARPRPAPVAPVAPIPPIPPMEPIAPMMPMAPIPPMDLNFDFDVQGINDQVRDAMRGFDVESARMAADQARMQADMARSQVEMAMAATPMPAFNFNFSPGWSSPFDRAQAPAPWAQGDPADSLYRLARETLNNGDYRRAAQLFADLTQKYPKSEYATTATYYQALSRYRLGSTDELKAAAKALQPLYASDASTSGESCNGYSYSYSYKYTPMVNGVAQTRPAPAPRPMRVRCGDMDVSGLYLRINGVLADRGDRDAAAIVSDEAKKAGTPSCDQEDQRVRLEALNALVQMDPSSAMPLLKKVIDRKDDCSTELRRQAVFMLGRRGDAESNNLLVSLAKSDPSVDVRTTAIGWLPRIPGDASYSTLEDILRTDNDERVQSAAIRALMSSDNPKARQSMRALIERNDAPINLRVEAINSFNKDRSSPDDAAYLRNLYSKVDNDRLKRAIIDAVSRFDDAESSAWLLKLAQNQSELSQYRSVAVSRLSRSTTPIGDLVKLYDAADTRPMRQQIIYTLGNRKEPEATDKLIEIAKNQTLDPSLRTSAIQALTRKNDPRSQAALMEIVKP